MLLLLLILLMLLLFLLSGVMIYGGGFVGMEAVGVILMEIEQNPLTIVVFLGIGVVPYIGVGITLVGSRLALLDALG